MASTSPVAGEDTASLPSLGSWFRCNSSGPGLALSGRVKGLFDFVEGIVVGRVLFDRVGCFVVVQVVVVRVDKVGSVFCRYEQRSYRWWCIN